MRIRGKRLWMFFWVLKYSTILGKQNVKPFFFPIKCLSPFFICDWILHVCIHAHTPEYYRMISLFSKLLIGLIKKFRFNCPFLLPAWDKAAEEQWDRRRNRRWDLKHFVCLFPQAMLWTSRQATGLASRVAWVPGWIPSMNTSWSLTSFLEKRKTWRCLMLHIRASRTTCEEGVCPWWHIYCHPVCSIPAQLCFICLFHFYCVFYCSWRGVCVPWHTHGGLRDDLQELVLYRGSPGMESGCSGSMANIFIPQTFSLSPSIF